MDVRRLWEHSRWADRLIQDALESRPSVPPAVVRELAHILGVDEVWLARLTGRPSRAPIWPVLSLAECGALAEMVHADYATYFARLDETGLARRARYTNTAGIVFETPVGEILLHVPLHAQYHRGKINQLLRDAGDAPVPADFISFSRGVPAAVTPPPAPA